MCWYPAPAITRFTPIRLMESVLQRQAGFTTAGNQTITLLASGTPNDRVFNIFRLTAGASQCTFTVDVLNTAPYATYVPESNFGDPNPCVYTVNGTYASNVALTNANTVEINAYVTEVGNFSISTERPNGMQFSLGEI